MSDVWRRVVAPVAVTMVCLALAACSGGGDGDDPSRDEQSLAIEVLPPIAQPGPDKASSEEASSVISAQADPASEDREMTLEMNVGGGWSSVDTGSTRPDGVVDFVLDPETEAGSTPGASYRVVAAATDDLEEHTSDPIINETIASAFGDEFDGDALSSNWYVRGLEYNPAGLRACSRGSAEAVEVADGELRLQVIADESRSALCPAKKANGKSLGSFPYRLNGHVATGPSTPFQYGVLAARIKFQRAQGQHGSFWLQSFLEPVGSAAESGAEIDVVEYFGDDNRDRLASFVYYADGDTLVKEGDFIEDAADFLVDKDDAWWKSYHVFALEWNEDEYVIRIDGREAWRTDQGISQQPQFIVLSLLSSDYELDDLPSPDGLPQTMSVDWVRHWPQPATS